MVSFKKEELQAYYTKSQAIVDCMIDKLSIEDCSKVLEPCAGSGIFVENILNKNPTIVIDAFEINNDEVVNLRDKFQSENVNIHLSDFLFDEDLLFKSDTGGFYDYVIANPPYGAWQGVERRKDLKKLFAGLYVKESYSLFLFRSIDLLKKGGELVFIIPDTFLSLHRHEGIRKKIVEETTIKSIEIFPSKFFPGINFGYADLCIIHLEKRKAYASHTINIRRGFDVVDDLNRKSKETIKINQLKLKSFIGYSIYITNKPKIFSILSNSKDTIGNIAECVTGFYSGNDKKYLKASSKDVSYSSKYEIVNSSDVTLDLIDEEKIYGIDDLDKWVPIVKGGNTRFYKPNDWFMEWTVDTVAHYKNDKKARFQNSSYYFKQGLAIPMVSSKTITASLLDYRLFDQSIVGVFPKDEEDIYYLLGYLNSEICNEFIRTINTSANNPANYIKRIPFRKDLEIYKEVNSLVKSLVIEKAIDQHIDDEKLNELNLLFDSIFK